MRTIIGSTAFLLLAALAGGSAIAADATDQMSVRMACSAIGSQADMHDCLVKKAEHSAAELMRVEESLRQSFAKWDEDAQYVHRAKSKLDASVRAFVHFRKTHCDFMASLAGGAAGNSRENMRLACLFELNRQRAAQLASARAALPMK